MSDTVAAVVVTYNRKELLIECLEALRNQTHKPDAIFIIDNNSNDTTPELLLEKNYMSKLPEKDVNENQLIQNHIFSLNTPNEKIEINYVRKFENDGGAGGFYEGMKRAYEAGYDWLWLMDDDGIPDKNCLRNLFKYAKQETIDYIAPNLLDNKRVSHFTKFFDHTNNNILNYYGGPFNGILISRYLVKKVGLPIKKFFIWGDEIEYRNRIVEKGFITITVKDAIHFHKRTGFKYRNVPRVYYFTRNLIFCARLFKGIYRSKTIHSLGVCYIIFKILVSGVVNLNFIQVKNCLNGIYYGLKMDVKEMQFEAINF